MPLGSGAAAIWRPCAWMRWPTLALGAAILISAALCMRRGDLAAQRAQTGLYLVHAGGTGATRLDDRVTRLFWAPAGDRFAMVQLSEGTTITVADAADPGDGVPVYQNTGGEPDDVQWSPDGGSLAIVHRSNLDIVGADGAGQVRHLAGNVYAFAWRSDGAALSVVQWDGQPGHGESLTTIGAGDGAVIERILPVQTSVCPSRLAWSPNGAFLAFSAGLFQNPVCGDPGRTAHGLWVWDAAAHALRQLETANVGAVPRWTADGRIVAERDAGTLDRAVVAYTPAGDAQTLAEYRDDCRQPSDLGAGVQIGGATVLFLDTSGDLPQIVILPLGGGDQTDLSPPNRYTALPLLSPDGGTVAYSWADEGGFAALAIAGTDGTPHVAIAGNALSLRAESWSAGGSTLLVSTRAAPLQRCERVGQ